MPQIAFTPAGNAGRSMLWALPLLGDAGVNDDLRDFCDGEGRPINPDAIKKPRLCLNCKRDEDWRRHMPCALRRIEFQGEEGYFSCADYREKEV